MLLSVLIPTYNLDCYNLVRDLSLQLPADAEIIVGDDGSTDLLNLAANEPINSLPRCRLWKAPENLGRARIRNRLAQMAQGEWLLFMDSDAMVTDPQYLQRYLDSRVADVVVGGTRAPERCPSPEVSLRYRYERRYWERATAERRNQRPYESFTAFNFMIRRTVMMETGFDEACSTYGHEDTLLGQTLEAKGKTILHIENPLVHMGLDSNEDFMRKTELALKALLEQTDTLGQSSTLLKAYRKLKVLHLLPLVRLWHALAGTWERKNLTGKHPCLTLFNIYKLGYYERIEGRE